MRLWLDTEFNGFGGALISMALVDESGREWYEVLGCENLEPWVATNVMPHLKKRRTTRERMRASLFRWTKEYKQIHVIADWPADFAHFCQILLSGSALDDATIDHGARRGPRTHVGASAQCSTRCACASP